MFGQRRSFRNMEKDEDDKHTLESDGKYNPHAKNLNNSRKNKSKGTATAAAIGFLIGGPIGMAGGVAGYKASKRLFPKGRNHIKQTTAESKGEQAMRRELERSARSTGDYVPKSTSAASRIVDDDEMTLEEAFDQAKKKQTTKAKTPKLKKKAARVKIRKPKTQKKKEEPADLIDFSADAESEADPFAGAFDNVIGSPVAVQTAAMPQTQMSPPPPPAAAPSMDVFSVFDNRIPRTVMPRGARLQQQQWSRQQHQQQVWQHQQQQLWQHQQQQQQWQQQRQQQWLQRNISSSNFGRSNDGDPR